MASPGFMLYTGTGGKTPAFLDPKGIFGAYGEKLWYTGSRRVKALFLRA